MNYIILDLEWNQGNEQREKQLKELPFEIIEIGAVKLNSRMEICDSFHELIRPQVYKEMHYMTKKLLQLDMDELQDGRAFPEVIRGFLAWCGTEEFMFGTWGPQDLTELQRNMKYFGLPPLSPRPLKFYDVQKLFSIAFEDKKSPPQSGICGGLSCIIQGCPVPQGIERRLLYGPGAGKDQGSAGTAEGFL